MNSKGNIEKMNAVIAKLTRRLLGHGVNPRVMGYFCKVVVQAVLLYGSETWTLTEGLKRQFQSFHSRVARFLTGKHIRPLEDGSWHCPPTDDVLQEAGLETVEEYILHSRRQTVRGFVWHRPMYLLCIVQPSFINWVNEIIGVCSPSTTLQFFKLTDDPLTSSVVKLSR